MPKKLSDIKCASIMVCLAVSLCASAAVENHSVPFDRIAQFDFCGLDAVLEEGPPFGDGKWPNTAEKPDVRRFLADPVRGLTSEALTPLAAMDIWKMHCLLVITEAAALAGDRERFVRHCEMFHQLIDVADAYSDILGTATSRWLRLKIGYVLAKVVNDRRTGVLKLRPCDIRTALPVVMSPQLQGKGWVGAYETFRRMLIVGACLEEILRTKGALPVSLDGVRQVDEREKRDFYGTRLSYRVKGNDWMLHSGGIKRKDDTSPWGVFIPCVEQTGGIPTDEVWYASTYSKKRKELYINGSIHDAEPHYRCYMRKRVVYRGEQGAVR